MGIGDTQEQTIKAALAETSAILDQIRLTLGQIRRFDIALAEVEDMSVFANFYEAYELTAAWTAPGDAVDVFIVAAYDGFAQGVSPEGYPGGPCEKDMCDFMTGAVVELSGARTGTVLAHEICHYLGLEHVNDRNNLMFRSACNQRRLTQRQARTVLDHCFVKP